MKNKRTIKIVSIVCGVLLLAGATAYVMSTNNIANAGVSETDAKAIALEQVNGADENDITKLKMDLEDGREEYEIEIIYDGYEYNFEISAETGRIIDQNKEVSHIRSNDDIVKDYNPDSTVSEEGLIGLEKAKSIALSQVSGATSANIVKAYADSDDGRAEYDIEIHYNGYEYEFEIDGTSGSILGRDTDTIDRCSDSSGNVYDDDDYDD